VYETCHELKKVKQDILASYKSTPATLDLNLMKIAPHFEELTFCFALWLNCVGNVLCPFSACLGKTVLPQELFFKWKPEVFLRCSGGLLQAHQVGELLYLGTLCLF
jgi:hypothetical protein